MLLIQGNEVSQYPQAMREAFVLRHEVFVEEKGWEDIRQSDGLEQDQFDTDDALHMLLYEQDELIGYQRMLPTTKPYLLSEVLHQLCETDLPNDCAIWEWTRFSVKKGHRKRGRKLSPAGNTLLKGIVEWGLEEDIHSIVIEMDARWLLMLTQLYFQVTPLGIPHLIENQETLAVIASFDERTLVRLEEMQTHNEKRIRARDVL